MREQETKCCPHEQWYEPRSFIVRGCKYNLLVCFGCLQWQWIKCRLEEASGYRIKWSYYIPSDAERHYPYSALWARELAQSVKQIWESASGHHYYVVRDLLDAMRPIKRVRCLICKKKESSDWRWRYENAWLPALPLCSPECSIKRDDMRALKTRLKKKYAKKAKDERRCWRQGKKTLQQIKEFLNNPSAYHARYQSPEKESRPETTSQT